MAGRRLGPLGFILALGGLFLAGDRLENYGSSRNITCSYSLARLDRPPPNLLILGNSRAGAAIDPVYVGRRIESHGGGSLTVERLAMTSPDTAAATVLARTYVRHRGAPQVVVLQLMYERDSEDLKKIGIPIHRKRSISFGDLADLYYVQANARLSPSVEHGLPRRLESEYRSFMRVILDKAITNIYSALDAPQGLVSDQAQRCEGEWLYSQSLLWQYDEGWPMVGPVSPKSTSTAAAASWANSVSQYEPIDLADPLRQFENHQLHELIRVFERNGSRVLVMLLPTFGQPIPEDDAEALAVEFSGNPLIDVSGYFARVTAGNEAGFFRDENHVNEVGAQLISRFLADALADKLR